MGKVQMVTAVDSYCDLIEECCNEWDLGYDQWNRQDIRPGGECDCSSLALFVLKRCGFDVGNATYTGNMSAELTARGWVRLPADGAPVRGDLLLSDSYHVAVYLGGGRLAQASIDERGEIAGGQSGDQTGHETNVSDFYDYPWDCYLRYTGGATKSVGWAAPAATEFNPNGYDGAYVLRVQKLLNAKGYDLAEDGVLGSETFNAVVDFQEKSGLLVDGIPGPDTVGKLSGPRRVFMDVRGIQGALHCVVDNVVGSETRRSAEALKCASNYGGVSFPYGVGFAQKVVGTVQDGAWGPNSMAAHDDTVVSVQKALLGLGYRLAVDGVFGSDTDWALNDALNKGEQA